MLDDYDRGWWLGCVLLVLAFLAGFVVGWLIL